MVHQGRDPPIADRRHRRRLCDDHAARGHQGAGAGRGLCARQSDSDAGHHACPCGPRACGVCDDSAGAASELHPAADELARLDVAACACPAVRRDGVAGPREGQTGKAHRQVKRGPRRPCAARAGLERPSPAFCPDHDQGHRGTDRALLVQVPRQVFGRRVLRRPPAHRGRGRPDGQGRRDGVGVLGRQGRGVLHAQRTAGHVENAAIAPQLGGQPAGQSLALAVVLDERRIVPHRPPRRLIHARADVAPLDSAGRAARRHRRCGKPLGPAPLVGPPVVDRHPQRVEYDEELASLGHVNGERDEVSSCCNVTDADARRAGPELDGPAARHGHLKTDLHRGQVTARINLKVEECAVIPGQHVRRRVVLLVGQGQAGRQRHRARAARRPGATDGLGPGEPQRALGDVAEDLRLFVEDKVGPAA